MDSHTFVKMCVVADFNSCIFSLELQVLRSRCNTSTWENVAVLADSEHEEISKFLNMHVFLDTHTKHADILSGYKNELAEKYREDPDSYRLEKCEFLDELQEKATRYEGWQKRRLKFMFIGSVLGVIAGYAFGAYYEISAVGAVLGLIVGLIAALALSAKNKKEK